MTRPGPKVYDTDEPLVRKNVMLTESAIRTLRRIGNGELSAGIRILASEYAAALRSTRK